MQKTFILSLLTSSALFMAGSLQAGEALWADPLPNTAPVAAAAATDTKPAVVAKPATGGIGYEWTVNLAGVDTVEFTGSVGAKSSYEPTFKAPEFAWQHTSDYIALNLTADAMVTITVNRQQGVTDASIDKTTNAIVYKEAGNKLFPVISAYRNWEESGVETGSFNPAGKTSWMNELEFIGISYADKGQTSVTLKGRLTKGKYTINIGGANGYAPNGCLATDASCYTGNHGYRATITTAAN